MSTWAGHKVWMSTHPLNYKVGAVIPLHRPVEELYTCLFCLCLLVIIMCRTHLTGGSFVFISYLLFLMGVPLFSLNKL